MSTALSFEIDGENSISIQLKNNGRLSLSDITAATIGNLGNIGDNSAWEEGAMEGAENKYWPQSPGNQSETGDSGGSVLRPWEDQSRKPTCPTQINDVIVNNQAQSFNQIKRQRNETETSLDPKKRSRFIEADSTSQPIYDLASSTSASNQPISLAITGASQMFPTSRSNNEHPIQASHSVGYFSQGSQNHTYGGTSQVRSLQTMQSPTATHAPLQPAGNSQPTTSDGKQSPFQPLSDNITAMGHFLASLQQASNPATPNKTVSDYVPRPRPREETIASSTHSYSLGCLQQYPR